MSLFLLPLILAIQSLSYAATDADVLDLSADGIPEHLQLIQDKAVVQFRPEKENDVRNSLDVGDTMSVLPNLLPLREGVVDGVLNFQAMPTQDLYRKISDLKQNPNIKAAWPVFRVKGGGEVYFRNTFYASFNPETSEDAARKILSGNGATPIRMKKGANGRVRCQASLPDGTSIGSFFSIVNKIQKLPGVRYAKPDIFSTTPKSRSEAGANVSNRPARSSVRSVNSSCKTKSLHNAVTTPKSPALTTTGPQWSRVVPVYYGFDAAGQSIGHGSEHGLVDNPTNNCNAVMVSSGEIFVWQDPYNWYPSADREKYGTDITYELENGILVGADVGVWNEDWNLVYDWCEAAANAGVYMICTDELIDGGVIYRDGHQVIVPGMDYDNFDEIYTSCKTINPNVLVGIYDLYWDHEWQRLDNNGGPGTVYKAVDRYCNVIYSTYGYYPDFIGLSFWALWQNHAENPAVYPEAFGVFQSLVSYAHTRNIKAVMYIPGDTTPYMPLFVSFFLRAYCQADAVFMWGIGCPWDDQEKPLIDSLLDSARFRRQSGGTDVRTIDEKGNAMSMHANNDK